MTGVLNLKIPQMIQWEAVLPVLGPQDRAPNTSQEVQYLQFQCLLSPQLPIVFLILKVLAISILPNANFLLKTTPFDKEANNLTTTCGKLLLNV